MEPLRFSLMLALVVFGAYAEYQAEVHLHFAKPGAEVIVSVSSAERTELTRKVSRTPAVHAGCYLQSGEEPCMIMTDSRVL